MAELAAPSFAARRTAPHWWLIAAAAVAALVVQIAGTHATAWHYFHDAGRLLIGESVGGAATGLQLYRDRPDFQFGPLSIVATLPFTFLGETAGAYGAMVAGSAMGILAFAWLTRAVQAIVPLPPRWMLTAAGVAFVLVWSDVAVRTAHLDDALALTATAYALSSVARKGGAGCVVALAVAAAAKPWAVAFAPMLLAVYPGNRRAAMIGLTMIAALVATSWLPFVLAEPSTIDSLASFKIDNDPTSTLRALGVTTAGTPDWVRPLQLLGGLALASLLAWRGRWIAVVLVAVGWRLLLDPAANRYYTAGALLGALAVELTSRPRALPWRSLLLAVVLEVTAMPGGAVLARRWLRLLAVAAMIIGAQRARPVAARRDPVSPAYARWPARAPASSSSNDP